LTGLLNKRGYGKHVAKAIIRAHDEHASAAVAIVDLDGLKNTNDTLGHDAGDLMLQAAADALRKASRETDIVARVGGDEYRIFLTDTTPELASAWEQRARLELEAKNISASMGITEVDLENVEGSTKKADELMYVEKRGKKQTGKITQIWTRVKKIVRRAE
jgi:diguanylate cyclase (GGDEF)-like protein